MRTPFGSECRFYYEDYHRGRDTQECHLVQQSSSRGNWSSQLCKRCPLPIIQQSNSCDNMVLSGQVRNGFLGLMRSMKISSYCSKAGNNVEEPQIGCGQCHADNPILGALTELDQAE